MQRPARHTPANSIMRRAYTLIEVLIVVAILGLAAAVLVPSMSGRGDFDTQAAVRALIADITFAQSDALANQEFRRVHFYEDGSGWCLVRVDEAEFSAPFDPSTADYVHDPLQGATAGGAYAVRFTDGGRYASVRIMGVSIDGGGRDLTFDELGGTVASGGLPGTGGTLILRSPDAAYRVEISALTGKVRVMRLADAQISPE
ncbi:MAG: type II secretion system protein [Limnohabitans sp.]|jgi:prepilin-type N-terminal cleavage/methylation domain-containing protein|nr:type II secretion system protein [Limnohabitans sp.]